MGDCATILLGNCVEFRGGLAREFDNVANVARLIADFMRRDYPRNLQIRKKIVNKNGAMARLFVTTCPSVVSEKR